MSSIQAAPIPIPPPSATSSPAPHPALDELRAAKLLEIKLSAEPPNAEAWGKLDRIYTDLETKYPSDVAIKNGHAEFLWGGGEEGRALTTWLAAEQIDPHNAAVLDHLGNFYLGTGDARKAAGYFSRAVTSEPGNAGYHFNYANVTFIFRRELFDAGHPDNAAMLTLALDQFAEAARLRPLDADYARAYAETFYHLPTPDWPAALLAWQHFYEITPQKDFALLNLARIHLRLGQKIEARAILDQIQTPEYERLKAHLSEQLGPK